ncbi:hypothetical protein VTL71DRAFT_13162 [Oculimacula yallundae]|uniref:Uncharacterized protein n=1 Tax=Oculimacula yallundae TaxID=86028 RepID=A0ABR4CQS9_9HELO
MEKTILYTFFVVLFHAFGSVAAPIKARAENLSISAPENHSKRTEDLLAMMHWKVDDPPVGGSK